MKIAGAYSLKADQHAVWDVFMNTDAIAKALPGVDRLVPIEGETNAWRVTAKIGIAAVSGSYTGIVHMTEIVPPDRFRLSVDGEGQGSFIGGSVVVELSADTTSNTTMISWTADANVFGRLAGVGQRLMAAAATMLARQFFGSLARQIPGADGKSLPPEQPVVPVVKEETTE